MRVGDPYAWDEMEAHVRIPLMVLEDPNLTPGAKLLFGLIRSRFYARGICYASIETLAAALAISTRQCQRHVRRLVAERWVQYTARAGKTNLLQTIVHPAVLRALMAGQDPEGSEPVESGGNPVQNRPATPDISGAGGVTLTSGGDDTYVTQSRNQSLTPYSDSQNQPSEAVEGSTGCADQRQSAATRLPDGGVAPVPPAGGLKSARAIADQVNQKLAARHSPLLKRGNAIDVPVWSSPERHRIEHAIRSCGLMPTAAVMIQLRRKAAYFNRPAQAVAEAIHKSFSRIAADESRQPRTPAWITTAVENAFREQAPR